MLASFFIHMSAPNGLSFTVYFQAVSASVKAEIEPIQGKALLNLHQL
jgi:hypothetical protein